MDGKNARAALALAGLVLAPAGRAQPDWTLLPSGLPPARAAFGMAHDAARGVTVLVGGAPSPRAFPATPVVDTWELDGGAWTLRAPPVAPPVRLDPAVAYDPVRRVVVLFGGTGPAALLGDTWEWNGASWTPRFPPASPSPRSGARMTWDPVRRSLLLIGGYTRLPFALVSAELWEWDGTTWTLRDAGTGPLPRAQAGWAFDEARGRAVLYGGSTGGYSGPGTAPASLFDTWEWDGAGWTFRGELTPTYSWDGAFPMVYHPGLGGCVALLSPHPPFFGSDPPGTWLWNGASWRRLDLPELPPPRQSTSVAYDTRRGRAVLFGGWYFAALGDHWELGPAGWEPWPSTPQARALPLAAFDARRRKVVLTGGTSGLIPWNDVWEWDGAAWARTSVGSGPEAQSGVPPMVYDTVRERSLVIVPEAQGWRLWEWDGTGWASRVTTGPSPRHAPGFAFDSRRGRAVLFGGLATQSLAETWELDGTTWRRMFPRTPPPRRVSPFMVFDTLRGLTVLHGGSEGTTPFTDTWEWDGTDWTERLPPLSPPARMGGVAFFDDRRGRMVVHSGQGLADTWEWDGTTWSPVPTSPVALGRDAAAAAYDAARGRGIVFGGLLPGPGYAFGGDTILWEDRLLSARPPNPYPGQRVTLGLRIPRDAGAAYIAAASFGTHPGMLLPDGRIFPGNLDALLLASAGANNPVFSGFAGTLDPAGNGAAEILIPPSPRLSGLAFSAAALTYGPGGVRSITNAARVTIR